MYELLEELHNLVNQNFPYDQWMMKQNHSLVNDPFQVYKINHLDFNVTVGKICLCGFRFHITASFKETTPLM